MSWRGQYNNLTFDELKDYVYTVNDTDIEVLNNNVKMEDVFIQPDAFCTKMTDFDVEQEIEMSGKLSLRFVVTDPLTENDVWINKLHFSGDEIDTIRKSEELYEMRAYTLQVTVRDNTFHKDSTCFDYSAIQSSYRECVLNQFKKNLGDKLGCLPEWISKENPCQGTVAIDNQTFEKFKLLTYELMYSRRVTMCSGCLPPCIQVIMFKNTQLKIYNLGYL